MHDKETKRVMEHAQQDLQAWMAQAPRDTNEQAIKSWQEGYIAGVQRGISESKAMTEVEEV